MSLSCKAYLESVVKTLLLAWKTLQTKPQLQQEQRELDELINIVARFTCTSEFLNELPIVLSPSSFQDVPVVVTLVEEEKDHHEAVVPVDHHEAVVPVDHHEAVVPVDHHEAVVPVDHHEAVVPVDHHEAVVPVDHHEAVVPLNHAVDPLPFLPPFDSFGFKEEVGASVRHQYLPMIVRSSTLKALYHGPLTALYKALANEHTGHDMRTFLSFRTFLNYFKLALNQSWGRVGSGSLELLAVKSRVGPDHFASNWGSWLMNCKNLCIKSDTTSPERLSERLECLYAVHCALNDMFLQVEATGVTLLHEAGYSGSGEDEDEERYRMRVRSSKRRRYYGPEGKYDNLNKFG